MDLILEDDVVSMTEFARNTREHTEQLKIHGRPKILTQNGKAAAVVLSTDAFQQMANDAEEYRQDMRLKEALESYARGDRGEPAELVFGRIRQRASARRRAK